MSGSEVDRAKRYDSLRNAVIPYYDIMHDETIELIASLNPSPKKWLDTGCGTGNLVAAAEATFPDTEFTLSDPSQDMLTLAREKVPLAIVLKPSKTQELADRAAPPYDVITSFLSHHYLSRKERIEAIRVCHSLLAPQGIFICFEHTRPATKSGEGIILSYWRRYQLARGRDKDTVESHLGRFDTAYFPLKIEEHIDLLKESGFAQADLFWRSYMNAGFYALR